jgi:excisionase family DNA binding protein
MIAKPVALLQIPNQAMFSPKAAARFLGVNVKTLKELTDRGELPARRFRNRRAYLLEDLESYRRNLPQW